MTTTATSFYAKTTITQDGEDFVSTQDYACEVAGRPTDEETIRHIIEGIVEGLFENDDVPLNLHDLKPYDFAYELVKNEKFYAEKMNTSWELSTKWEKSDTENWEHPTNL